MAVIDPSWVKLQEGLYLEEYQRVIGGTEYTFRKLHSADGWCFYDATMPENYDEDGNLKPASERLYAQYRGLGIGESAWTYEQLNAKYISVPVDSGYEIVSISQPTVDI